MAIILGITGLPGSGKTEFAKLLKKKKFHVFEMGSVVLSMMVEQNIPLTNVKEREFATNLRKKYGKNFVAKETVKRIKKLKSPKIAIIGIRSKFEIDLFKKHFKNILIIALMSPAKVRFVRMKKRGKSSDPKNLKDFTYRERVEKSWGFPDAIKSADCYIYNTGTLRDLEKDLNEIISKL